MTVSAPDGACASFKNIKSYIQRLTDSHIEALVTFNRQRVKGATSLSHLPDPDPSKANLVPENDNTKVPSYKSAISACGR